MRLTRRLLSAALAAAALAAVVHAQVPGRNVNMVSGGTYPGGDPFLQKQNEPSIAMSTRNHCHLLAGANDYRAVNILFPQQPGGDPADPKDQEVGDAWLGWYESTDCGATWYSTLVPGYPQDNSALGLASPVSGLRAGADPVVRSSIAGQFYYLFIAFNRGTNVGKLALARGIDHNDRESFIDPFKTTNVDERRERSPIRYVNTVEVARGSAGQFIDKPYLAVFPTGTGTCTLDGETVPASTVLVSWTEFIGNSENSNRTKVMLARSADCGLTWGPATKLTEGFPVNQGSVITVSPTGQDVWVFWRQVRSDRTKDALLYVRSADGGRTFSKAQFVPGLGEGQFAPFDQNTTSRARGALTTTFRTVAYPTATYADDGYVYLAISQVPSGWDGGLGGAQARITMLRTNGTTWEGPTQLLASGADGQQFMPALTYAAGKLQLIWYDVRYDEATPRRGDALIDDAKATTTAPKIRRTIDLLGAQASLPALSFPPVFQPYGISQPDYNDLTSIPDPDDPTQQIQVGTPRGPRISQYLTGDALPSSTQGYGPRQLEFNRANLLLYGGGTIPFIGDYVDIAPIPWVLSATGQWMFNGVANATNAALSTYQAAWTDNRDAGIGKATTNTLTDGTEVLNYVAPTQLLPGQTIDDVQCPAGVDNTQTRDANVYTSRITNDFSLSVPTNNKPTTAGGVVRAFAVQLSNHRDLAPGSSTPETPTVFKLLVVSASASFSRHTFLGTPEQPSQGCTLAPGQTPVSEILVSLLPRTSAARTVYVKCGTPGPVIVTAIRMNGNLEGPSASVALNADPTVPATKGPNGSVLGPESHNPDTENPDTENPDTENPDTENPDTENPDTENPDTENPDTENPDTENPDTENPDTENPDTENPDTENAAFQDISVGVTNNGNTTSAYQVNVQSTTNTTGYSFLLTAHRAYATPISINCALVKQFRNQQLFAIQNPDMTGAFLDETAPTVQNTTILIRPGESIRLSLRAVWDSQTTQPFCSTDPASPSYCFNRIRFQAKAQAPNSGDTEPAQTSFGIGGITLAVDAQPTDSIGELPMKPGVRIRATDPSGAALPGIPVTIALGNNPSAATLAGTLTETTDANGIATFSDVSVNRGGYGYTLVATAGSAATPVATDPFDVFGFAPTASLPSPRYFHGAARLDDGRVLILGGNDGVNYLASALLYDPNAGTFTPTGSMATARALPTVLALPNGKVLVTGGFLGVVDHASAELYDPATGTFSSAGTMLGPGRTGHSMTLLNTGNVLIAGGSTNSASLADAQLYDPSENVYTAVGSMGTARTRQTATRLTNGNVLVTGGDTIGSDVAIASAELFNPATNTFTAAATMATARDFHTATFLPSGRVLVAGGRNGVLQTDTTELYDPGTNTFVSGATMADRRAQHTATHLQDDTVLIAGGFNSGGQLRRAQIYLPNTDNIGTADGMDTPRSLFTATLLFDGRVLIVGGNSVGGPTAGAELYLPPPTIVVP